MALTSETIINEWRVETEQGVVNVDRLYKKIVQLQREEKKQEVINKALEKAYEDLNRETKMAAELAAKEAAALTAAREAARKSSLEFDNLANSVAKSYSQANKHQTVFGRISSTLNGSVRGAFSQLSGGMVASIASGNLLAGAIAGLGSSLMDVVSKTPDFTNAISNFKGDIVDLRYATQGLSEDLDLMNAYNRLSTLGVKLTSDEFTQLAGNLTKVAQVMNKDMPSAWEATTAVMGRGSVAFADNVGVVIKAEEAYNKWAAANNRTVQSMTETEKKLAIQKDFLEQISEKAKALPELQRTALQYLQAEWNGFKSGILATLSSVNVGIGSWISSIGEVGDELDNLYRTNKVFRTVLNFIQGRDIDKIENLIRNTRWATQIANTVGEAPVAKEGHLPESNRSTGVIPKGRLNKNVKERQITPKKDAKDTFDKDFYKAAQQELAWVSGIIARKQEMLKIDQESAQYEIEKEQRWKSVAESIHESNRAYQQLRESLKTRDQIEQENFGQVFSPKIRNTLDEYKISYMDLADSMGIVRAEQKILSASSDQLADTFVSSGTSMVGSMWSVADQAIQSGESFGMVALKMVKQHAIGLAGQLFADGVKYTFQAQAAASTFPSPTSLLAPGLYAAAAKSYAGSAAVGALGLGLSFATRGSGGGGAPAASSRSSGGASSSSSSSNATSFAAKKSVEAQPIYVQLYLGDPSNPSTALLAKKQVTVLINQANQGYSES